MNTNLSNFIKEIKTKCSDIYNFYEKNKLYLFSGRKNQKEPFFKKGPVINRKPVDTPQNLSYIIDNAFMNNDFKAMRSNSVFCTGSVDVASSYGEVYIVYPKNGFDFTWSRYFDDLYFFIEKIENNASKQIIEENQKNSFIFRYLGNKTEKYQMKNNDEDYIYNALSDLIEKLNLKYKYYDNMEDFLFDNPDLFDARNHSMNELNIIHSWIKKYAKLKKGPQSYEKNMLNYLNKVIPKYYQDDDLFSAIKSKHEIMVRADEYYFIKHDQILS